MRKLLVLCAALFVAAHVPFLPAAPGDLESINFALAVREFDVAADQPHPPGYPLYVGLARLATAGLFAAGDPLNAAHALALVNVIGGALALVAVFGLGRALDYSPRRALAAAVVAATVPLFWFSASRPLNDLPALAAAVAAQACLARVWLSGGPWHAAAGAVLAGAAMGLGPGTAWLTLPLMAAAFRRPAMAATATRLALGAGFAAGMAAWIAPLVGDAGSAGAWRGLLRVFDGLGTRDNLIAAPGFDRALAALADTFLDPFGSAILAAVVLAGAAVGALIALAREPVVLRTLAVGYLPYLAFHLIAQETLIDRFALPALVPIALLFVIPFAYASSRAVLPAAAGIATAGLAVVWPAMQAYASDESPGFAVIGDLHQVPRVQETVLAMHERVSADLRRHQAWAAIPPMRTLPSPVGYEWYELAKLWQSGYDGPIWFLADPGRTDLRLIDPQSRTLLGEYGWPDREIPYLGGMRPNRIDWYFMQRPGWFLGEGWALTPEIRRLTARAVQARGGMPAVAWVRRRPSALTMAIGGRHLGAPSDPPLVLRVTVDGRQVDEWPIEPGPFLFMRPVLPEELAGEGATYAKLEIAATWQGTGPAPVALEQFDVQSIDGAMVAYDQGWWEPEHDARTGRILRWTSGEATLWLYNPGRDLSLILTGAAPRGREMTVFAGERELGRFDVSGDFSHAVTVPAETLSLSRGRVTLRLSETHVPVPVGGLGDRRALGARLYDVRVH